jgi:hypothetical protein
MERVRKFRNRLAHHDSMINVDVPFEIRQIIELASYIDTDAAKWLERRSEAMAVYGQRPVAVEDTVIVAARTVERIAFYADREIKRDIPKVLHRRDNVEWTKEEADRLRVSADRFDRKIAQVIDEARSTNWTDGLYQVFLLTRPGDPTHRQLSACLPHGGNGRGSAFTQRQRYVSLHSLELAASTEDL